MMAGLSVLTILLSACAGALASFFQVRMLKRDEILLDKIERAYASAQDFTTMLDIVFLDMEKLLNGRISRTTYYEFASKEPENVRAFRDLQMYLSLYFPNLLQSLDEMYESRGRLIEIFHRGESFLESGRPVDRSITTSFAHEVVIFNSLTQALRHKIMIEARRRFVLGPRFKS